MPYIKQEKRDVLDPFIDGLHHALVELEMDDDRNVMQGNINYVLTRLLMMVYGDSTSTNYDQINEALGILSAVDKEFYRIVAAPYEEQKKFENGEIVRFRTEAEVAPLTDVKIGVTLEGMLGHMGYATICEDPLKIEDFAERGRILEGKAAQEVLERAKKNMELYNK